MRRPSSKPWSAALFAALAVVLAAVALGCSPTPDVETVTIDSTTPPTDGMAPDDEPEIGDVSASESASSVGVPLSARAYAVGAWTGTEVLVFGGDPEAWCPPNADCSAPDFTSLSDGAAFDPVTETWRTIADAPVPITRSAGTVAPAGSQSVFVLTRPLFTDDGRDISRFLRYDVAADQWTELSIPPDSEREWPMIIEANGSVLAYSRSDEQGERNDYWLEPESEEWIEIPNDPFPPSYDRVIVPLNSGDDTGDDRQTLLLMAKPIDDDRDPTEPPFARTARLDPATGTWTEGADAEVLWSDAAVVIGDDIVFPYAGTSNGGQVNGWGREVSHGGILNATTEQWRPLPAPAVTDSFEIGGVIGDDESHLWSTSDLILDVESDRWLRLPINDPDNANTYGRTVVGAGPYVVAFGGEVWDGNGDGRVIDDLLVFEVR